MRLFLNFYRLSRGAKPNMQRSMSFRYSMFCLKILTCLLSRLYTFLFSCHLIRLHAPSFFVLKSTKLLQSDRSQHIEQSRATTLHLFNVSFYRDWNIFLKLLHWFLLLRYFLNGQLTQQGRVPHTRMVKYGQ